mmetsp:Transcript_68762/g.223942  ORF Transcript_68762/g.223942 Transcript_68762/m.223942 type:complete len:371 (-) Transcript_68762:853-1965(-)
MVVLRAQPPRPSCVSSPVLRRPGSLPPLRGGAAERASGLGAGDGGWDALPDLGDVECRVRRAATTGHGEGKKRVISLPPLQRSPATAPSSLMWSSSASHGGSLAARPPLPLTGPQVGGGIGDPLVGRRKRAPSGQRAEAFPPDSSTELPLPILQLDAQGRPPLVPLALLRPLAGRQGGWGAAVAPADGGLGGQGSFAHLDSASATAGLATIPTPALFPSVQPLSQIRPAPDGAATSGLSVPAPPLAQEQALLITPEPTPHIPETPPASAPASAPASVPCASAPPRRDARAAVAGASAALGRLGFGDPSVGTVGRGRLRPGGRPRARMSWWMPRRRGSGGFREMAWEPAASGRRPWWRAPWRDSPTPRCGR